MYATHVTTAAGGGLGGRGEEGGAWEDDRQAGRNGGGGLHPARRQRRCCSRAYGSPRRDLQLCSVRTCTPDWLGISNPQGSSRCNNPCSSAAKHGLLLRRSGRCASQISPAVPRPHAAGGGPRQAPSHRRRRRRGQQCAGARCTAQMPQASAANPPRWIVQVEELRQRLSAIMPPLEVDWQQDVTINATRLPSAEQPPGSSPFGASFAFQRRHSMRLGQRDQHTAAAMAQQVGKQGSPQPDEQLHGDSRSASGGWALRCLDAKQAACAGIGLQHHAYRCIRRCVPEPSAADLRKQPPRSLPCPPSMRALLPSHPALHAHPSSPSTPSLQPAGGLQWTDSRKLLEAAIAMEQLGTIHEDVPATTSGKGWGWGGGGWGEGALDAAEQRLQVGACITARQRASSCVLSTESVARLH